MVPADSSIKKLLIVDDSIGLCTGIPENDDNLLNKADTALYQAKQKGRNQCISLPLCETEKYLEQ